MEKNRVTITLSGQAMEKLDGIMEGVTYNRSRMIELAIHLAHTYFDHDQLHIEHQLYSFPDGRSNDK